VAATPHAHADDDAEQREAQFKAAYLFNFVKFVEWPARVGADSLTICFVGGRGIFAALSTGIDSKRVGTRRLVAKQVEHVASTDNCNALYVDATAVGDHRLEATLPILTVSDAEQFTAKGGMIELFTDNRRLRFLINIDNAQKAGLRISSDLLKLAADVQRGPQ
jgi:hypothetical protein